MYQLCIQKDGKIRLFAINEYKRKRELFRDNIEWLLNNENGDNLKKVIEELKSSNKKDAVSVLLKCDTFEIIDKNSFVRDRIGNIVNVGDAVIFGNEYRIGDIIEITDNVLYVKEHDIISPEMKNYPENKLDKVVSVLPYLTIKIFSP